jgi:hypothetical protein
MALQLATRPWIIAGVGLVGISPVIATPTAAASPGVQMRAVQLTSFDPNNWTDVLQLALPTPPILPTTGRRPRRRPCNRSWPTKSAIGWSGVGNPLDALASLF